MPLRRVAYLLTAICLATPPASADSRTCVIEAGRDISARDISLQCGISEEEVAAIRASLQDLSDGQAQMQAMLLQLIQQTADYERMRAGGVTEANLISLARKVAEDVTDPGQAFAQLSRFVEIAIDQQRRARENPSSDTFVAEVQRRVAELSAQGQLDAASAEADRALALWEAEQENQRQRGISLLETARDQDILAGRFEGAAARTVRAFELAREQPMNSIEIATTAFNYLNTGLSSGTLSDLKMAEALLRFGLSRETNAAMIAAMQGDLSNVLQRLGGREAGPEGTKLLAEASVLLFDSLERTKLDERPVQWAAFQFGLGQVLMQRGTRAPPTSRIGLLSDAIAAYGAALAVRTRDKYPNLWASTQFAIGRAHLALGIRVGGPSGKLHRNEAEVAFRASLEEFSHFKHPEHWASSQLALGKTLVFQARRGDHLEELELLAKAVLAFRAAQQVYNREDYPFAWADAQNNLSATRVEQGRRTDGPAGGELLTEAVAFYRTVLQIRTRDSFPLAWARTQENIALAHEARAEHHSTVDPRPDLTAALEAVENALTVFDPVHLSYNHAKATRLREDIQAALDAL